jgi:exodeoxyribonuclease VII large subunit
MVVRAGVDVLIIGRGGGAVTDLSAFNHERVVRTIARCPVPVISAVGHETDLSLADLAADARASTPTAAAELAVADGAAIAEQIEKERRRLDRELRHRLDRARQDLDRAATSLHVRGERALTVTRADLQRLEGRLAALHPRARILTRRSSLGELERRLAAVQLGARLVRARADMASLAMRADAAMRGVLEQRRAELGRIGAQLAALSPLAILDRGYAMVAREDRSIVRSADSVRAGDRLALRLARGSLAVTVDEVEP